MINLKLSYIISHPLSYVNIPKKHSKRRTNVLTYYKSDDILLANKYSQRSFYDYKYSYKKYWNNRRYNY